MTDLSDPSDELENRLELAMSLAREAGEKAAVYFRSIGDLVIHSRLTRTGRRN